MRLVVVDSRAARVLKPDSPLDPRPRRDGLARRAAAGRRRPRARSAPRCRSCSRPGSTTPRPSARGSARARGASAPRASASGCARPSTSSTGRPSSRASARWPTWCSRSPPAAGAGRRARSRSCPATSTTATSRRRGRTRTSPTSGPPAPIMQAVCSPIRNPLAVRAWSGSPPWAHGAGWRAGCSGWRARRRSRASPLRWELDRGPWYDNNLAVLEVRDGGRLHLRWVGGRHRGPADRPAEAPDGLGGRRPAQAREPAGLLARGDVRGGRSRCRSTRGRCGGRGRTAGTACRGSAGCCWCRRCPTWSSSSGFGVSSAAEDDGRRARTRLVAGHGEVDST